MSWRVLLVLTVAACGRFGFDAIDRGDAGSDAVGPGGPVAIATGDEFTCALANDKIACWGDGHLGALGNGTMSIVATPVPGPALTGIVKLEAGLSHVCALDSAGAMSCWGDNHQSQLATGGMTTSATPVAIAGLPAAVAKIAVGGQHTCAILVDNTLWCWGKNARGQIGIGSTSGPVATPTKILDNVTGAGLGDNTTCAVRGDGSVWCWGDDTYSELGDNATTNQPAPQQIAGLVATQVTCGNRHCCALVGDNYSCWGYDNDGELGDGNTGGNVGTPVPPSTDGGYARLAGGVDHTCALKTDGSLACWGFDFDDELGDGAPAHTVPTPTAVTAAGPFVDFDSGGNHSCGIRADGSVACWGYSSSGQVGNGMIAEWSPVPVALPGAATAIAAGATTACALVGGTIYCWGNNWQSELGNGSAAPYSTTPVQVTGLSSVMQMSVGTFSACAFTTAGVLYCWGINSNGQIGDGTLAKRSTPVVSTMANVAGTSVGALFACGVDATSVQCWGDDADGELGDVSGPMQKTPKVVLSGANPSVNVGYNHGCSVVANSVQCWGENNNGELGIGTAGTPKAPTTVAGAFVGVICGGNHTCGKTMGGAVQCWGENTDGEVGDGSTVDRNVPTTIAVPGSNVEFELGGRHTCAHSTTGTYCWGHGTHGELGDGTATAHLTPGAIAGVVAAKVAAGFDFSCALDGSGTVSCWGDNARGQIGNGKISSAYSPVEIALPP